MQASGGRRTEEELPEHLAVVLEFAASAGEDSGGELLTEHRAGVELLRLALSDAGSLWAGMLDSVRATLPPLRGDQHTAVARLVAEGPPAGQVGLAPFAPPEYLAAPTAGGRR